jgi:hypothetical protein
MPSPPFEHLLEPGRLLRWASWASPAQQGLREALRWGAHHSGLPVVVVAALALVVSFRVAKRAARLAVEVVVATAVLLVATRLGWIAW